MPRSKSIGSRKHRKILKQAKGFRDSRHKRIKVAKEAVLHAGQYAYVGRKLKKRDLRKLWIMRINAAARELGMSYSRFMSSLKKADIQIDRKILADLAAQDKNAFKAVFDAATKSS